MKLIFSYLLVITTIGLSQINNVFSCTELNLESSTENDVDYCNDPSENRYPLWVDYLENEEYCRTAPPECCPIKSAKNVDCASFSADYGGIKHISKDIQKHINLQLKRSFDYLLLASHFSSYKANRPGFQKLFQDLSDRSFDDGIRLIKYTTRRGGRHDFSIGLNLTCNVELDEIQSLSLALQIEKELATDAMIIHSKASQNNSTLISPQITPDPELCQYLEEKFLKQQAKTIRRIAGYANDLARIIKGPDATVGLYLFDEYLLKPDIQKEPKFH